MKEETDYINLIGMLKICLESGFPEGKSLLKAHLNCPLKAHPTFKKEVCLSVAKHARKYYNEFEITEQ